MSNSALAVLGPGRTTGHIERLIAALHRIHAALGPGLPCEVYRRSLEVEAADGGVPLESPGRVELFYGGRPVGAAPVDGVVDGRIVVLVGAERFLTAAQAERLQSLLAASRLDSGVLLNFGLLAEPIARHRTPPPAPRELGR